MRNRLLYVLSLVLLGFLSCTKTNDVEEPPIDTEEPTIRTNTLLTGREIIWGMGFLPNGELLFSEKRGRLYRLVNGEAIEISGLPNDINTSGQGGLLDLCVHPQHVDNGLIYMSYAAGGDPSLLKLVRFQLNNDQLSGLETIFETDASNAWQGHYGSRIAFDPDGLLYLSIGEGGPRSYGGSDSPNQNAQNIDSPWGKIHRLTDNGEIPEHNPRLPEGAAPSSIFAYGIRNPQGLAWNPFTNELWATDHGPSGGDEVNIIASGNNYGWPLVSWGENYDGTPISDGHDMEGITNPIHYWSNSIGIGAMAFISSDDFKAWKGDLLVASLAQEYLSRLEIHDNEIVSESMVIEGEGRIRNVKQAPDGTIYVSLEDPGRIIQLIPE
ncbi:PQQ-dependent sugar dehydrogenase [Olivibacter sp. SDN3]|uniref:PQQ-dependent sugar dehydrogenase n=1 Tax=Olivibacter sp. SDN3 TaxID=2764720 RepID=UPI001650E4F4|nr:PQQ-dependent sugar dehydrogenase [Olivibacter sp. SDN3]QNL49461.1 PQQ-dependent sugar dehydrogenase [Olivibacter sp. SDN3]